MRSRHPIYPQEDLVVINSSSISNKISEPTTKDLILAKSTRNVSEAYTNPLSQGNRGKTTTGMGGFRPGNPSLKQGKRDL